MLKHISNTSGFDDDRIKYLKLLSQSYKNIKEVTSEIINLNAILNMPKGTEHFVSDIHGEYYSFHHVLKNGSGVIKNYIEELFGNSIMDNEKRQLATLIYYPKRKLELVKNSEADMKEWYKINIIRILKVCKRVSSKYTKNSVRKRFPKEFSYILEELMREDLDERYRQEYVKESIDEIINTIIELGRADNFIIDISNVIYELAVSHLHIIGDIYDRGPYPDKIMDLLEKRSSLDFQWGNHDIAWMGAFSGSEALICNVIRVSARYNNLHIIEEAYGINLAPLVVFAMETYRDDDCEKFLPVDYGEGLDATEEDIALTAKIHKTISIMQFKIEAELIKRRPEFDMDSMILLDKIDFSNNTVEIDGNHYKINNENFPTVDPKNPLALSKEEKEVIDRIKYSFKNSDKLKRHTRFLFNKGGMYTIYNSNLLFHGCIPLNEDGSLKEIAVLGEGYKGKALLDQFELIADQGHFSPVGTSEKEKGLDIMWYLWCGKDSPLYGKDKIATFERYFVDDPESYKESKDPYYSFRDDEKICRNILKEFGIEEDCGRIINGHVPVEVKKGESPVKANGKLIVIDGGFARAYQDVTGIAGYTLISNSRGILLSAHEPFASMDEVLRNEVDVVTKTEYIEKYDARNKVADWENGKEIKNKIDDLKQLFYAYNSGIIKESN